MDEVDAAMAHMNNELYFQIKERERIQQKAMDAVKDAPPVRFCIDCDAEIPTSRIAAVPWTQRCVSCQEAADQTR